MSESTGLDALQSAAGGIRGDLDGMTVTRHYGNPAAEYDAVRNAVGIVHRSDLTQVRMWGRDPRRMLNGLITNDLEALSGDHAIYAVMLGPKGRIITELRAISRNDDNEILIDVPVRAADAVADHLKRYVPPLYARWEMMGTEFGVLGVYGPRSRELLSGLLGIEVPKEEDGAAIAIFAETNVVVVATRIAGGEIGFDLFAPDEALPQLWTALVEAGEPLGAIPVGFAAFETLRIEAGRPRYGMEMTEESLPAEVFESIGAMPRAVSFTKGCYTGQEVVIRIAHRGRVNRHLRGLLLGEHPSPVPRTPLFAPETGKEIGWITSSANSPRMGQVVALAMVRREFEPGAPVHVGAPDGEIGIVADLPFANQ